jgi:hypothetical protein
MSSRLKTSVEATRQILAARTRIKERRAAEPSLTLSDEGRIRGPGNRILLRFALERLLYALAAIRGLTKEVPLPSRTGDPRLFSPLCSSTKFSGFA